MANRTGVTPNKLYGVGARGVSEGSKPGPKVSPPTYPPNGPDNPDCLYAMNMQEKGRDANAGRYRDV